MLGMTKEETWLERVTYRVGLHRVSYWLTYRRTGLVMSRELIELLRKVADRSPSSKRGPDGSRGHS